jgi:hypothetical protein
LIIYRPGFKNILADIFSCYKQDTSRQKALRKAYCTQVLLTSDKLNPEIIYKLFTKLAFVLETFTNFLKAFIVLTNNYVLFNLINHIFTANKQSPFLENKRAKAIKGN